MKWLENQVEHAKAFTGVKLCNCGGEIHVSIHRDPATMKNQLKGSCEKCGNQAEEELPEMPVMAEIMYAIDRNVRKINEV